MAPGDTKVSREAACVALAACAFFVLALFGTGAASWMRATFAEWGLSRTGVNAAFGAVMGAMIGLILRGSMAWSRRRARDGRGESSPASGAST